MKKLRMLILAVFIFGAALSAGALGMSLVPSGKKPAETAVRKDEYPYFLQLAGSVLSVYQGGRTEGTPDEKYPVELSRLTSEDILLLSCGITCYNREEYLMTLEGLGVD